MDPAIGGALAQTLLPPAFLTALTQTRFDGVLVFTGGAYIFCQCDQTRLGEEGSSDYEEYQEYREQRNHQEYQGGHRGKRTLTTIRTKILTPGVVRTAITDEPTDSGYLPLGVIRCGTTIRGEFAIAFYPPSRYTLSLLPAPRAPRIGDAGGERGAHEDRDAPPARPRRRMPQTRQMAQVEDSMSPGFQGAHQLMVALPGMVFAGCARRYYAWAVREETFAPDLRAFHAPLPNVGDGGLICWGSNTPPEASPRSLDDAWRLFLASPFNGDYAQGKCVSEQMDVRLLLAKLAERRVRRFPARELAPLGYRNTIDDLVEQRLLDRSYRSQWRNWDA